MAVRSAGILLWRRVPESTLPALEVWIAHMGGPFWAKKDAAAWSIPKGEYTEDEDALTAALREFGEEVGVPAPRLPYVSLGDFRQSSGKVVTAFAAESDFEVAEIRSNTFDAEWPPRSGRIQQFPEIDRAEWMSLDDARIRIVKGQLSLLDALEQRVG
ncbi:MAG TPA: NUDIX domain-containing protein [Galbitalea sp.]|jgi:predicted NUDIX family NTP pyrophosphohydrolase|nr:NUDIX domain-containing protein [Galbitalea sp.]